MDSKNNWLDVLNDVRLTRSSFRVLLFLDRILPDGWTAGQYKLAELLDITAKHNLTAEISKLTNLGYVRKTPVPGTAIKEISLAPDLKKRWALGYVACLNCGSTQNKYRANGLCRNCYYKKYMEEPTERFKEGYMKRHPESMKYPEYYVPKVIQRKRRLVIKKYSWNKKYPACTECKGTERPHYAKGYCHMCYLRNHRRVYRQAGRDKWFSEKGWIK